MFKSWHESSNSSRWCILLLVACCVGAVDGLRSRSITAGGYTGTCRIVAKIAPSPRSTEFYVISEKMSSSDTGGPTTTDSNFPSISFLILNAVAIIWGTQHVVIKSSLEAFPSPSVLNFWRFATSSLLFLPPLINAVSSKKMQTIRAGAELGLYTTLGFAFQSIGLLTTTASRSAFLLYLNVKIVPFLACLLLGRSISVSTWASALLALSGTTLLSTDGGPINVGDAWCIAAAAASALFILRIEKFSREHDAAELSGVSFATVAALCALWIGLDAQGGRGIVIQPPASWVDWGGTVASLQMSIIDPFTSNPWPIVYLGAFSTGICNYLQTVGQRDIAAEKAAVIYSMDPVYGAGFSYLLLGEELGLQGFAGAVLIMAGLWLSATSSSSPSSPASSDVVLLPAADCDIQAEESPLSVSSGSDVLFPTTGTAKE